MRTDAEVDADIISADIARVDGAKDAKAMSGDILVDLNVWDSDDDDDGFLTRRWFVAFRFVLFGK